MIQVSIIMPTYDRGHVIFGAIRSVLDQTYTDWELIVVDDGSGDDTVMKVKEIIDNRITLIHYDHNLGANHARNVGLAHARGDVIAFLDSDNAWEPTYLERQIDMFEDSVERLDVVFARTKSFGRAFILFPEVTAQEINSEEKMIRHCLKWSIFDTNVTAMRRTVYEECGGFDEAMPRFQDWDYFLSILVTGRYHFAFLDEVLCQNSVRDDSITRRSDLFWDARLAIFEKNLEICREFGIVEEVLDEMLHRSAGALLLVRHYRKLGALLKQEEQDIVPSFHDKYNKMQIGLIQKDNRIIAVQNKWLRALCRGRKVEDYFCENNVMSIAVYGFGILGQALWEELENSNIKIRLVIDARKKSEEIRICRLDEVQKTDVELVVNTALIDSGTFEKRIERKLGCRVVSIEEIVSSLL